LYGKKIELSRSHLVRKYPNDSLSPRMGGKGEGRTEPDIKMDPAVLLKIY
jgi:hypothetical protein